jgi:signal transduction histidine kinase
MLTIRLGITDDTTIMDLDRYFTSVWCHREPVKLVFDTTQCSRVSLRQALRLRRVLNKHRSDARKYIDHSEVLVRSARTKRVLTMALCIIRTDRPVKISIA